MYAALADPIEALEAPTVDVDGLPKLRRASAELLAAIAATTQLRHARYCGVASAIGEIAVRALAPLAGEGRRALLTASVDPHRAIAEAFGRRLHEAGPRRLNPIMFPHTLPSATAATLGAQFRAHVCAIALDGRAAVQDALSSARVLLDTNQAVHVILFVCIAPAGFEGSDPSGELAGIAILLGANPISDRCLRVVPQSEAAFSKRDHGVSLKQDLRVLTMLASRSKYDVSGANPATVGGHLFHIGY